jgi:hypothetical protein
LKTTNWKDIAELIGITAIVASLIFVGIELRQSQRIAFAEQEGAQIADFQAATELIASNSSLIRKLNDEESLTAEEKTEADQLVYSIWATHFFTRQRASYLDHPSVGIQERVLATIFYENPGLRRVWAAKDRRDERYFEAMGRPRRGAIGEFNNALAEHLATLDKLN